MAKKVSAKKEKNSGRWRRTLIGIIMAIIMIISAIAAMMQL
jgi:hypothetical protein